MSCDTGKVLVVADMPNYLKEVSAVETTSKSDLIWVIEDSGNNNHLYGLDESGSVKKDIKILNSKNIDWEDLTSDKNGNIYIGDFGNNSKKRKSFTIYKVVNPDNEVDTISAEKINFVLPNNIKSQNFESFFLFDNTFYIFSKDSKTCRLLKIPNVIDDHTAILLSDYKLKGKHSLITSADISDDGKTIVLLNHDKVWQISDFKSDDFFNGIIKELKFGHYSQKEGVCFKTNATLYLTDESNGAAGSNIYAFQLY
jgi:hypothetical protein